MSVLLKEIANIAAKKAELLREEANLWNGLSKLLKEQEESSIQRPAVRKKFSEKNLLTAIEAAEYLGIAEGTLAVWRCVGKGPSYVKIGKVVRYAPSSLDEFIKVKVPNAQFL